MLQLLKAITAHMGHKQIMATVRYAVFMRLIPNNNPDPLPWT